MVPLLRADVDSFPGHLLILGRPSSREWSGNEKSADILICAGEVRSFGNETNSKSHPQQLVLEKCEVLGTRLNEITVNLVLSKQHSTAAGRPVLQCSGL